jgi:site-specific DNA-methyltransferase (adenine-specific)
MDLYLGDCLEVMKSIPDESIDMVLTDPPYGTIACKWDLPIPFEPLWNQLRRISKSNSAICLFGGMPFGANLVMSNIKEFRHEWIWQKTRPGNFVCASYQPMRDHESVMVFSKKKNKYYPIKETRKGSGLSRIRSKYNETKLNSTTRGFNGVLKMKATEDLRYPSSVQLFNNIEAGMRYHPTQKPVALLEYLIKTYTLEGETVLDFTMGSGSTGVACKNLKRKFIGIEQDEKYYQIACERINGSRDETATGETK